MSDVKLTLIAIGVAAAAAIKYTLSCWWWPFARCWRCEGAGRFGRADSRVWRTCRRCGGSGRRLRIGRWLYNHAARIRRGGR